jgi:hypothetical protein
MATAATGHAAAATTATGPATTTTTRAATTGLGLGGDEGHADDRNDDPIED